MAASSTEMDPLLANREACRVLIGFTPNSSIGTVSTQVEPFGITGGCNPTTAGEPIRIPYSRAGGKMLIIMKANVGMSTIAYYPGILARVPPSSMSQYAWRAQNQAIGTSTALSGWVPILSTAATTGSSGVYVYTIGPLESAKYGLCGTSNVGIDEKQPYVEFMCVGTSLASTATFAQYTTSNLTTAAYYFGVTAVELP